MHNEDRDFTGLKSLHNIGVTIYMSICGVITKLFFFFLYFQFTFYILFQLLLLAHVKLFNIYVYHTTFTKSLNLTVCITTLIVITLLLHQTPLHFLIFVFKIIYECEYKNAFASILFVFFFFFFFDLLSYTLLSDSNIYYSMFILLL